MSNHVKLMKEYVRSSKEKLVDLYRATHDVDVPVPKSSITDIREKTIVIKGKEMTIPRLFIFTPDTGEYAPVGWVLDEATSVCLQCFKEFGSFTRKHHCRACGSIICSSCCGSACLIRTIENTGKQKNCSQCYSKRETIQTTGKTVLPLTRSNLWGKSLVREDPINKGIHNTGIAMILWIAIASPVLFAYLVSGVYMEQFLLTPPLRLQTSEKRLPKHIYHPLVRHRQPLSDQLSLLALVRPHILLEM